jgi:hypothetical protein
MEDDLSEFKKFVKENIPFSQLKKAGFFKKEVKFNDYKAITERILSCFGYNSISEYLNNNAEFNKGIGFINGSFPDKIDTDGNLQKGGSFHLSLTEEDYYIVCPICECEQEVSISTYSWEATKKCMGCKRKIKISIAKEGISVVEV